jgi:hypothetical protein
MRGATECARRLKRLVRSLKSKLGKVSSPHFDDPITQLILGVFSRDMPESKARDVLDRLKKLVVDYNELRVMSPREMAEHIGDSSGIWAKCEDVSRALNKCFATQHAITLDFLKGKPKKEVRDFLDDLEGLDAYSRARIRLLGLQQHAMPLDEAMWAYARKTKIVDPACTLRQAQSFLERQIAEADAIEVYAMLKKQAWSEMGAAVRHGDVKPIRSVPPDRVSRNMLQLIERSLPDSIAEGEPPAEPEPKPEKNGRRPAARKKPAARKAARAKPSRRAKPAAKAKKNARKTRKVGRKAPVRKKKPSGKPRRAVRKKRAKSA